MLENNEKNYFECEKAKNYYFKAFQLAKNKKSIALCLRMIARSINVLLEFDPAWFSCFFCKHVVKNINVN